MNEKAALTYERLQDVLQAADADCGAAESHGLLCGIICAAGTSDPAVWLDHLLGAGNDLSAMAQTARTLLTRALFRIAAAS